MRGPLARSALLLLAAASCGARAAERSAPAAAPDRELRAAYLFNIVKFVTWPDDSFRGPDDPLVLCIVEDAPLGRALAAAVTGKTVGTRPVAVREPGRDARGGCHLVYSSGEGAGAHPEPTLRGVLTVGDQEATGAIITLFTLDQRLRFSIDAEAARQAGLSISSRLLQLAIPRAPEGRP